VNGQKTKEPGPSQQQTSAEGPQKAGERDEPPAPSPKQEKSDTASALEPVMRMQPGQPKSELVQNILPSSGSRDERRVGLCILLLDISWLINTIRLK
jgi:hypothetical protein